jgi:hypothetical protein
MARHFLRAPQFAADHGNARCSALGLPARRKQPRKFGFICEDQNVGVSQ